MTTFTIELRITGLDFIAQTLAAMFKMGGNNPGYTFLPADPNPQPRTEPQYNPNNPPAGGQTVAQYNPPAPQPAPFLDYAAKAAMQAGLAAQLQTQPQLPLQSAAPAARTVQDVKNAMAALLSAKKMEPMAMVGILGEYGARRADDLKPEHIEVVLMRLGA